MKTVIALYDLFTDAQAAVSDLMQAGVDREDISLMGPERGRTDLRNAGKAATVAGYKERERAGALASADMGEDDVFGLAPLAVPGIGPVMATGRLAVGYGELAGGRTGGGFAGLMLGWGIPDDEADYYVEGVRRGGTMVLATVEDAMVNAAIQILNKYEPIDLENRSLDWREAGWSGFDPQAEPYTGDVLTIEDANATRGAFTKSYPYHGDEGEAPDYAAYESSYRRHYDSHYADTGYDYVDYQNAYRFGSTLGGSARYVDLGRWTDVEPAARTQWEATHDGAWDDFKDAVRHGWNEMKQVVS